MFIYTSNPSITMISAEISFSKQDTSQIRKEITIEDAKQIIEDLCVKFNMNLTEVIRKIARKEADGFSLNKNNPYMHLYIGNGSENISIELMTLEKETKIKVPKSFFL